ncbi:MAG TPA: L,D-transpeptidase family protein, partial [Steroidobacteraceae bacterium]|nr:L,D-transpeptidase family protein [Steroidobacteraceae bacterium]
DLGAFLEQLAAASDVHQTLASIEPTFYHYRLLEQTLQRYRRLAIEQQALPALPLLQRRSVKPGEYYVGAPQLRNLLRLLGDLPGRVPASATAPSLPAMTLDPELVAGLQHFQIRHGLAADGTLGKTTFTALATPLTRRVRQIELTLERWRWLPPFDTPPIIVNIPEFRLFAFRGTQDRKSDILQMDVIVGRTYLATQTPVFAADMRYVIFRPYWEVPYSIAKREMLPLIRADSRYLSAQHLQIVSAGDSAGVALAPTAANIDALATGRTRLRQAPGPDNALGLIKFMLPNAHNVYLHATPAHRLFGESRRAFSHGCIRVSDPVALAVHVLRNASDDWTAERIEAAMNGASTLRVDLARPIRVLIVYGTVLAMESGDVYFFDDIYGHDRKLESLLGLPAT